jgi:hypothetical protein
VSWIKRKNVQQLLTVGLTTYANDERFQAIHFHHSEDWTLQIKYVQPRDAGLYECQVSTHPPTSIFLFLEVVGKRKVLSQNLYRRLHAPRATRFSRYDYGLRRHRYATSRMLPFANCYNSEDSCSNRCEFLCFKATLSRFSLVFIIHVLSLRIIQNLVHARAHEELAKLVFFYYFILLFYFAILRTILGHNE